MIQWFSFDRVRISPSRPHCLFLGTIFLIPAFVSVFSPLAFAGVSNSDLRVVHSDAQSFVVEFTPKYVASETVSGGSEQYARYDFQGSYRTIVAGEEGRPDLRSRLISLGFPTDANNVVRVIASDYEDIPNVLLAPVPSFVERDGMMGIQSYQANSSEYSINKFMPEQIVGLSPVGNARSMFIGSVMISPLQYNSATRTLRKYSRIVVEVLYGTPAQNRVQRNDHLLVKNSLLNYDVAKSWMFAQPHPLLKGGGSSVLAAGFWYRIPVTQEGIYILDAAYLGSSGVDINGIDPQTIKIYGNGGGELPELVTTPRPVDLVENAIYVQGESDGVFNDGDFIIFYGKGTRGWTYNSSTKLFDHHIHHYSDVNYYWLTYDGVPGKRMLQQPSLTDPATVVPDRFTGLVLVDEDTINLLGSGKDWYGPTINTGSSLTYSNPLTGFIPGSAITYRYSLVARSVGATPTITVSQGSTVISQEILTSIPSSDEFSYAKEKTSTRVSTAPPPNNTSQLTFAYSTSYLSGAAWLNWLEIQFPRSFAAAGNYLRFRSPDTTAIVEYQITGFTAAPFILDVTDPLNAKIITGATGSYTFRAAAVGGTVSEYCAVAAGAYKVPDQMSFVPNQDIHGITEGYDFIIVTSKEFKPSADQLAAFREQPEHGDLRTIVLDVDNIYNEFSGGVPDITGIRDMLQFAYSTWSRPPMFVLFFGQGSYDYKSRLGFRSSYAPTWESVESRHDINSYASDDFFAMFGTTAIPSLVTGRLNPRTTAEADFLVGKLMSYDNDSARDPWKMRILIVGDDSWTSEGEDGDIHSSQAESLAENHVPAQFEKRKIYIAEYPTVISAQGRRKPGAYQAIIDEINKGTLIVNYTGHGNPTVWAHESIFSVQTSIPLLVNANRLAVFFLATCNFSQFDDPNRYTGSELLLNKSDGGAIGVVSATRKVFAIENFNLNIEIYDGMFLSDQFGRTVVDRPATALFEAKLISNSLNDQKYFYLGDPTMKLQFPPGYASIDSINSAPVDTISGVPRADSNPIQIRALQMVTVKGTTRDAINEPDGVFSGTMTLVVNDATRRVSIAGFPPNALIPFSYAATGGTIYRGVNTVGTGQFTANFIVPKDILYADSTTRGRLSAYITDGATDAAGYTLKVYVGGTDTSATPDNTGPTVSLYLNTRTFRSGDHVSDDPLLIADLVDSSGINTSVSGIGHRIEAWLNGSAQSIDITDQYTSTVDDFRRGTVQYVLRDLPYGKNTIRVRAWDAFNNSSTSETSFEVTSGDKLTISDVFNYPNPFSRETAFTFRQNQLVPLNVTVRIYTLAGRLIETLQATSPGDLFIQVPWDGRDHDGDLLANGVYLYKLTVSTVDGRYSSDALSKLTVLK